MFGLVTHILFRPANYKELFNLRHASLRNAIERIFGILKKRFPILRHGSEYPMEIQARIPPALCALHNFIRVHDPEEIGDFVDVQADPEPARRDGILGEGPAAQGERRRANRRRDDIAKAMWTSYVQWQEEHGDDDL